ncbi:MMPL family transporter [candidate division KSB1 bacterium]|nr:MMPL family transporter [candidate division KSB1 bacterium]
MSKNHKMNELAVQIGMNFIIKYKYFWLLFCLVLVVASYFGLDRLIMDSSNDSFFSASDETTIQNQKFKDLFGNEEFVFVFIEANEIFIPRTLQKIRDLTEDLEKNIPFAKEVISITNVEFIDAYNDVLEIHDLIPNEIPQNTEELQRIRDKVMIKKVYVDKLITRDGKKTGILISFERLPQYVYLPVSSSFVPLNQANWPAEKILLKNQIFSEAQAREHPELNLTKVADPRKLISPALSVILKKHEGVNFKVYSTGVPVMDFEVDRITTEEGGKFGLWALIISLVLLFLIFRQFVAIISPFFVLLSTLLILFGVMGWLGIPVAIMSMVIPILVLVISVSYSIHVIHHFQHGCQETGSRIEAIRYTYKQAAWPCFVTAATTAMGFASFLVVPIIPIRDVGIICALGVFITYLLVMILIPIGFSFGKEKVDIKKHDKSSIFFSQSQFMTWWSDWIIKNDRMVMAISFVIVFILFIFSFRMRLESDFLKMMGTKNKMVEETRYITQHLGGMYSYEVMIELPEDGAAKEPAVLIALDSLSAFVNEWKSTALSTSITEIIKDMNMTMHQNDSLQFVIPETRESIAQYFLLYEMSGGEGVEDWVDYDYRILRLSVQTKEVNSAISVNFPKLKAYAQKLFPEGTKTTIAGDIPIGLKLLDTLSWGQIYSIFLALVVITITMIFIIKSIRIGLISMIPNIMPILVVAGLMGLFNIPLDLFTILIAPMIVGIAVDDTIHYMLHFKQEYETEKSYLIANRLTLHKVGKAIVFTSVILIFGFMMFGFSAVRSLTYLGILSSAGIMAALLADLFVTPILFVTLRPFDNGSKKREA